MNLGYAKKLKKEYDKIYDDLFKKGESLYGMSSKYNEMPGYYANEQIKLNPKYNLWAEAIKILNRKFSNGYLRHIKKVNSTSTLDIDTSVNDALVTEFANQLAYTYDRQAIRIFKSLSKEL